ncbi:hypothetical protein [Nostoc sp. PA-18-2419]|nr:hypothetical protein [Nostoc sp. PA-18-2419]
MQLSRVHVLLQRSKLARASRRERRMKAVLAGGKTITAPIH